MITLTGLLARNDQNCFKKAQNLGSLFETKENFKIEKLRKSRKKVRTLRNTFHCHFGNRQESQELRENTLNSTNLSEKFTKTVEILNESPAGSLQGIRKTAETGLYETGSDLKQAQSHQVALNV
ncbi:CLUMA_CG013174, isoform A [Clunio marinus]|uniref:CLUMA_CG013174, isoform A n=1 Tax=Clunio marinus TaxID=568069 RepID=A0A1J1IHY6_9DIPT|nr:CLUMA_CG013174, isoform A [Clunio marinus]